MKVRPIKKSSHVPKRNRKSKVLPAILNEYSNHQFVFVWKPSFPCTIFADLRIPPDVVLLSSSTSNVQWLSCRVVFCEVRVGTKYCSACFVAIRLLTRHRCQASNERNRHEVPLLSFWPFSILYRLKMPGKLSCVRSTVVVGTSGSCPWQTDAKNIICRYLHIQVARLVRQE